MPCSCGCTQCSAQRMRPALVPLGELRGLIYRARRRPGEAPKNYVHFFSQQLPLLAVGPDGRRLYIIGGRYRVTARGIEG